MDEIETLTEVERLLLMAAAVQVSRPAGNVYKANTWRVVRQAGRWLGMSIEEANAAVHVPESHPIMLKVFEALVRMTSTAHDGERGHAPERPGEPLFEGAGNWGQPGDPEKPPADPPYTACWLTPHGERLAQQLLERHPEYRKTD